MANLYFTSDWHIGHKNILKFQPDFETVEHRTKIILDNYNRVVTKRDKIIFGGDIAFDSASLEIIAGLLGRKVLILGNHDTDNKTRPSISDMLEVFVEIHSMYKHKEFWITHAPIHTDELRGKKNIHGHTHGHVLDDPRYLNICLEQTDYTPIDLNEVRYRFLKQEITASATKLISGE
jgi:calcineurin-like phosphoesterase family protein